VRSQINGNLSRLLLSDDGKTLWADLRYWPSFDETPPPSGLLRWEVAPLIAAAERNSLARQALARPLPIDLEVVDDTLRQVVTPTRYELGDGAQITSGWVVGMAASRLRTPDSVFFGDRPLNNPGYHEFQLGGSVGGDPASDNTLLDVARVEQRLNRANLRPRATSPKGQHCQKEFSRCSPWISHP
jgi:hypothetical protein